MLFQALSLKIKRGNALKLGCSGVNAVFTKPRGNEYLSLMFFKGVRGGIIGLEYFGVGKTNKD